MVCSPVVMGPTLCQRYGRGLRWMLVVCGALMLGLGAPPRLDAQSGLQSYPDAGYFLALPAFYSGEYKSALDSMLGSTQGGLKIGVNRWVDSICYHTMTGEALYELGRYGDALEHYTTALQLYLANQDWMVPVRFDASISPAASSSVKKVPWGQSRRTFRLGAFKNETMTLFGKIDNNAAVRLGGVVQPPSLFPVHVQEIVRCTALALHRRRELMGPLGPHNSLTNEVLETLSRKRQQSNHWSSVWIDVQLGMAFAAAGKDAQAKTVLERALVASGEYDHPLTAMAMLELGRIALDGNDYVTASKLFEEATYTAVNFGDLGTLLEAFQGGFLTHILSNQRGMYPPLLLAADWARREGALPLQASLLSMAAENAVMLGDTASATKIIAEARQVLGQQPDMVQSRIGARINHVSAMVAYQQGNLSAGDTALKSAMDFQQHGSLGLFHILLTDRLLKTTVNPLSSRVAMDIYKNVLRDPQPVDWVREPLESLSVTVLPHPASYENWFEVALERREYESALEIADLARRHRFYSALDLGGRLLNLREVVAGAPGLLSAESALERQELLSHYPQFGQLAQQAAQLRQELRQMPLASADSAAGKIHGDKLAELARVSAAQEVLLRQMSVRREPCSLVFPPFRTTQQVRESLRSGEAVLVFFCTSRQTHGFLMTSDKFAYWPLNAPAEVHKQLSKLLKAIGNWDQNKQIKVTELSDDAWKPSAQQLLDLLTKGSKASIPYDFQQLVIVPDGPLWYVPFEALQSTDDNGEMHSLISQVKMRYAPTMGLAVPDPRPRVTHANMAVVLGRLFPNADKDASAVAFQDLKRSVPEAVALEGRIDGPSNLLGSLFDRMVVLAEIAPTDPAAPLRWSPVPIDDKGPGSRLENWIALPWGGPDQVVLPGFHSAAENGLKDPAAAGQEIFMSVCGLMSCGARTVLISRWRPGGQSSYDLVREFVQELPYTTAADAWQRSVELASETPLNPQLEPRISEVGVTATNAPSEPPTSGHPFFWAGFVLVDTGAQPQKDDVPAAVVAEPNP